MGVERGTNNDTTAGNNDINNQQQSSNRAFNSLQKNQNDDKQPGGDNNNNNCCDSVNGDNNDEVVIEDSNNPADPILNRDLTNNKNDTINNDNMNHQQHSSDKNHHFTSTPTRGRHLKLNTTKAFQQQQEQTHQHHQRFMANTKHNNNNNSNRHCLNNHDYLAQLLKDKRQVLNFPSAFIHVHRILDNEINRVRVTLLHQNNSEHRTSLPEPEGEVITMSRKLYVPQRDYPDFNFVGRILGPRGMTAKQLEHDTGCKIMIRGRGSMRDKAKEESYRGKPNWEHLDDDLHVLISVEDTQNRASIQLTRAVEDVQKLLVPSAEGVDSLKKLQLMELAIINGTYRDLGRSQLQTQMAHMSPFTTTTMSNLPSPQVCMAGPSLLGQVTHQPPPPTPTLVTTPVLLTPRIAPYFPPPGTLTRTTFANAGQQHHQMNSGMIFQIDPNYVAVHHSPFLEFALFGRDHPSAQDHPQEPEQVLHEGTMFN